MNNISFIWREPTSLGAELAKPIKQVFLEFTPQESLIYVTFWRSDGTGVGVGSEMHHVAKWREVGVLNFSYVLAPPVGKTVIDVASRFERELTVSKLIIQESGTTAESGIALRAGDDEIVVVASASPCLLALSGVSSQPHIFEPEYSIEDYKRVPFP